MEPLITFVTDISQADYRDNYQTELSGLTAELPPNVHLLTLEQWKNGELLLRLEHFYQKNEDPVLSKPVTVGLSNLLKNFEIVHARELTLSANADIEAIKHRMQFKYTPVGNVEEPEESTFDAEKLEVTLNPMQIRTFVVRVRRN